VGDKKTIEELWPDPSPKLTPRDMTKEVMGRCRRCGTVFGILPEQSKACPKCKVIHIQA